MVPGTTKVDVDDRASFKEETRAQGLFLGLACLSGVVDLAAQEIIRLPDEDRWLDADFEEVYRIGSLTGEDWEQFGSVRKVAFNEAGQLYVFDGQADRMVVVGSAGEYLRGFGRRGEGPGEFRNAVAVAVFVTAAWWSRTAATGPIRSSVRTACSSEWSAWGPVVVSGL